MDQVEQENELQRAIDNITKNGGGQGQPADVAAGLEEQIQNQMGTPPVPPMPEMGQGPAETMPPMGEVPPAGEVTPMEGAGQTVVENEAVAVSPEGTGVVQDEVTAVSDGGREMPTMAAAAPVADVAAVEGAMPGVAATEPVMETAEIAAADAVELSDMGGNDINSIKEAMLRDLFPIMDKVEMGAEEKFELYRNMLENDNDKSLIAGAYEVVKGITDEGARAEALLFLIKKADA